MALFMGGVFLVFNDTISNAFSNNFIVEYKYLIFILIVFSIVNGFFKNFSLLTNRLKKYLMVSFVVMLSMLILQVINILSFNDMFYTFLLFTFAQIFMYFLLVIDLKKYMLLSGKNMFISIKELKYILPISIIGIVGISNELIDQFMVSFMLDPLALAELKVGSFRVPFIGALTIATVTVLIPIFSKLISENKENEIIQQWNRAIQKTTVLLLPIFVFSLIFAYQIIGLLFSNKYEIAPLIFQIYTIKYFLTVVTFGSVMGAIGLQKEWLNNFLIVTVVNIVANYFAIKHYGILGAVTVTAAVQYFGSYLMIAKISKRLNCSFSDYFPYRHYLKVLIVSLFYTLVFYTTFRYFNLDFIWVVPIAIGYYLVVVYTFDKKFEYIKRGIV